MKMHIEVDQSGKIEQMNKDSVIAFSYRGKVKQLVQKLFAICVFYCLKDYVRNKDFDKKIIRFSHIGKKSAAHKIAKSTNQGEIKPNKILTKKEILRYLKNA